MRPDSLTPRMFSSVMSTIKPTPSGDALVAQARERGDRHDGGDPGRDRHRDRQHVVDHQRRAGDERRVSPMFSLLTT